MGDDQHSIDLSAVDEIIVTLLSEGCARFSWSEGDRRNDFDLVDDDSGYVDPEDIMWWLLRHGAPIDSVRRSLADVFPEFDVDAENRSCDYARSR
jgi:hypothetical protein